jgi:hypothetical protein
LQGDLQQPAPSAFARQPKVVITMTSFVQIVCWARSAGGTIHMTSLVMLFYITIWCATRQDSGTLATRPDSVDLFFQHWVRRHTSLWQCTPPVKISRVSIIPSEDFASEHDTFTRWLWCSRQPAKHLPTIDESLRLYWCFSETRGCHAHPLVLPLHHKYRTEPCSPKRGSTILDLLLEVVHAAHASIRWYTYHSVRAVNIL